VAVIAHWRCPEGVRPVDEEVLLRALRELVTVSVDILEVVVLTNDVEGTRRLLRSGTSGSPSTLGGVRIASTEPWAGVGSRPITITVERWRPRGFRRHGFYLTWGHKRVFQRALRDASVTHLIYLEDDIGFNDENFRYWVTARRALDRLDVVPAFVRFEHFEGDRRLVDQARPGQRESVVDRMEIEGIGVVSVQRMLRPYQAMYVMDRALSEHHFRSSALRSPLRSRVCRWDVRERAAAGTAFAASERPLGSARRLSAAPGLPPVRHVVLMHPDGSGASGMGPIAGALIEHLRPTYSTDPSSLHGKTSAHDL